VALARIRVPALLAVCALAGLIGGCGGSGSDGDEATQSGADVVLPPSPLARIAVQGPLGPLDPLYVNNHSERLVSRQIYDPPVARLDPPLGVTGRRRGPLRATGPKPGSPDWYFELRSGIRFQDGSPLNAQAIVLNAQRWLASGMAKRVVPELDAVDTPVPGSIRFQLSAPVPDLPARISDPRFGLIAPATLHRYGLNEIPGGEGGSGAFAPEVVSSGLITLGASSNWWGMTAELGPGVDRLEFRLVRSAAARAALLREDAVDIADDLASRTAKPIARQPLLAISRTDGRVLGASAAVRGLRSGPLEQPLSEIWFTQLRP
jgi:MarR-like DNA-binding transcriptional regulator SgrR of sgrS sRNA